MQLAERSHYEALHAHQVQRLALQLFDAVGDRIGLEASDRRLLSDAAVLHDIGYHINFDGHHKHSYHLIIHAELLGMTPAERVTIANVARYHRGAEPKMTHQNYGGLERTMRRRIRRLAALLRIAYGFDRGHVGAVDHLEVEWGDVMRITAVPVAGAGDLRLEVWGASRKAGLLSRLARVPVEIEAATGGELSGGSCGRRGPTFMEPGG
jgi:exopolyphosphatase/guanosine-5'-triphosphate,3'-diphosphate pyrophosphatase